MNFYVVGLPFCIIVAWIVSSLLRGFGAPSFIVYAACWIVGIVIGYYWRRVFPGN